MAQLSFTQNAEGLYVAHATINGNVALHVEREEKGYLTIKQRSTEIGKYATCYKEAEPRREIVDADITASVFPKYLEIVSTTPITWAEIVE